MIKYGLLTLRTHSPNPTGSSPIYSSTYAALLSAEVPRLQFRQADPASRGLVKDQVREGWIKSFDYQFMRKLPLGDSLGLRKTCTIRAIQEERKTRKRCSPSGWNSDCLT